MRVTVEVSKDAVRKFGGDEARFGREMYEAAVVHWYNEARVSWGKAAELLRRARAEFLELLFLHKVPLFQYSSAELAEEFNILAGEKP